MSVEKMRDDQKTKAELLQEVDTLRKRVAELRQMEEALRESEQKWRSLLNNTPDIVMIVDRDGTIRFINHTVPGIKEQEAIGKKVYDYISPEHHDTVRKDLERIFQTGQGASHEVSGVGRQGALSWYQAQLGPIRQDGRIVAASIVTRDITERKKTEEEIKRAAEEWNKTFDAISDLVFVQDKNFTITKVNKAFPEALKLKPEDIIGKKCYELLHKSDKPWPDCPFEKTVKDKESRTQEVDDPNIGIPLLITTSPIFDDNGKLVGAVHIAKDITERKKAEEELRTFEERFSSFAERSFDLIFMTDAQGHLTYVSGASEEIFHYKPEEMVGTHFKNYLIKSEIPRVSQRFAENMKDRNLGIFRMEAMRKDGSHVFIELNSSPILKDGETIGIQGIIRDITERKRAEEALRESEKRFREIFENIAVGVYRTTPDGQILMANPALVHMLGYSSFEELSQRNLEKEGFEPQYQRSKFKEEIEREGRIVSSESTWITRDGKKLHVIENARAVRDEDGKTLYYEGTAENITERKKAEEKLKQYQFMVESAHDAIFFKDLESRYVIANNKTLESFGLSREQVIGKSDYEIMPDKAEAKRNIEDDKLVFKAGKPRETTKHMTGADGKGRWFQAIKVPRFDDKGKIIGLIGIARDITRGKQAEEELDLYREKMAHAEQLASLGTLSATLTHELNQPLTAIRLSIENSLAELETTSSPDTVIEDLKDGLTGVSDAASIVKRFNNLAGKSSGKIVTEVNLKAVAERIVKLLKESARRARVSLHLKGMDKLPPIRSNEKDLEQLFFSLVENAIQAADGKKNHRLIISGGVKDEHIELRFADTCSGIAPKNLDKIFEPFFTTRPIGERTGMGLCIVERIVSGAGGKIRVESKAGKGSTFFVTLPISRGGRS